MNDIPAPTPPVGLFQGIIIPVVIFLLIMGAIWWVVRRLWRSLDKAPSSIPPLAVESAKNSLFTPVIVVIVAVLGFPLLSPYTVLHRPGIPVGWLISALIAILFSGQGLRLGIKALVAMKEHKRTIIFWKALVGTCVNGLLLLFLIVAVILITVGTAIQTQQPQQKQQTEHRQQ